MRATVCSDSWSRARSRPRRRAAAGRAGPAPRRPAARRRRRTGSPTRRPGRWASLAIATSPRGVDVARRRRLRDLEAGAAAARALRVAALEHEVGHHAVERQPVVEAVAHEPGEGVGDRAADLPVELDGHRAARRLEAHGGQRAGRAARSGAARSRCGGRCRPSAARRGCTRPRRSGRRARRRVDAGRRRPPRRSRSRARSRSSPGVPPSSWWPRPRSSRRWLSNASVSAVAAAEGGCRPPWSPRWWPRPSSALLPM